MITIYRVFQIILGIILSAFILYILIYYAGSYALVGEQAVRLKTLDVFLQDADNIYFSGNPINFTRFSRDDYTSCHPRASNPPRIFCYIDGDRFETEQTLIPVFTKLGGNVLITRNSLDYGWTRIDYIEAVSGMRIIFNPLEDNDAIWESFKEAIIGLPDTTGFNPKATFGFCEGQTIIESDDPELPWERDYFHGIPTDDIGAMSKCSATLFQDQILVTISPSCSPTFADSGICISPPQNGVGYAYISGSSKDYVYKDPADLAALIIGGEKKNEMGDYIGEEIWEYKNKVFLDSLTLAAKIMQRRCGIIFQSNITQECSNKYFELQGSLIQIETLAKNDPYNIDDMASLKSELDNSRGLWLDLLNMGCESYGSG